MNIPHYNTWLDCVHANYDTCLVKSNKTGKSFPVNVKKELRGLIRIGDRVHVIKSHVTGEWTAIDYMAMWG